MSLKIEFSPNFGSEFRKETIVFHHNVSASKQLQIPSTSQGIVCCRIRISGQEVPVQVITQNPADVITYTSCDDGARIHNERYKSSR